MYNKSERIMDYLFSGNVSTNYRYNWNDLDIGALLSCYLFEHTDVTQADIAKDLNLAPISVSRQIKNKKSRIKDDWKPTLEGYIYQLDLDYLEKQIEVIKCILSQAMSAEAEAGLRGIIDHYLTERGLFDGVEFKSIMSALGYVKYINKSTGKNNVFRILPDQMVISSPESIKNLFPNNGMTLEAKQKIERMFLLCGSDENFAKIRNWSNDDLLKEIVTNDEELYLCHVNKKTAIVDIDYRLR